MIDPNTQTCRIAKRALVLTLLTAMAAAMTALSGCGHKQVSESFTAKNITGVMPTLQFKLTNADGATSTENDFKHLTTLMYFGFTNCPYVCPTTLSHLSVVLKRLGPLANSVRVLFVSVDPQRDTPQVLKRYTKSFAPQVVGLTGTDEQLTELTKRFRVAYRRDKPDANGNYAVYHSSAIFIFDGDGDARLLATPSETDAQLEQDLRTLINEKRS